MMRGVIIVAVTLTVLIAMVVGVVGAGLHRIAAAQKQADESWQRPNALPTTAPATNPTEPAITAADEEPAIPPRNSINLDAKDAARHGDVQLADVPLRQGKKMSPELALDPRMAEKIRQHQLMRGNQNTTYLTGYRTVQDFTEWQIDIPKAGEYEVDLTYAIPKWQEGGTFLVKVGDREQTISPESTRGDTNFRVLSVGKLTLGAGRTTLSIRPAPISIKSHSFMNLRGVQLIAVATP